MKINATEFKAKCLQLMDEVAITHEPVIITKRGKPVAKLIPVEPEAEKSYFDCVAGTTDILGDIITPIEEPWAALTGEEDHLYDEPRIQDEKAKYEKDEEQK